jgi:LmbE family N-acetylglucosaminyl deacetylase
MAKSIFEFLKPGLKVLALSPHADDIELGCGATLLYLKKYCEAEIHYRLFCPYVLDTKRRNSVEMDIKISRVAEARAASDMLECDNFKSYDFDDRMFPRDREKIQTELKKLRYDYNPDLIFAPRLDDNHQDHVTVAEAAVRTFRDGQAIWHYEIKQFGQQEFDANIFVNVSNPSKCGNQWKSEFEKFCNRTTGTDTLANMKVFILQECMKSQKGKMFLDPELLLGTMKLRAAQCAKGISYAEAFYAKTIINLYNDSKPTKQFAGKESESNEESTEGLSGEDAKPTKFMDQ